MVRFARISREVARGARLNCCPLSILWDVTQTGHGESANHAPIANRNWTRCPEARKPFAAGSMIFREGAAVLVLALVMKGEEIMSGNTIRLHRVLHAPPERVYRAFLDGAAMTKWLPPNGFTGKVHHIDAKVGGTYKMSFTNFSTGKSHSFGGEYLELVPHERIRHTDRFDDPNLPGEMQTTITLKKVFCGTELNIVQEGVPDVIPAEACYLGWQDSLNLLAKLVEAEIPD